MPFSSLCFTCLKLVSGEASFAIIGSMSGNNSVYDALQGFRAEPIDGYYVDRHL